MNNWLDALLDELGHEDHWSYQAGGVVAAEPTALAALALASHGRLDAAHRACQRLVDLQAADGSVPVTASQPTPCWTTGWAVQSWIKTQRSADKATYRENIERAIGYVLSLHGRTLDGCGELGHNSRLDGWPWVEGTHPWSEPTAINLLALKASGHGTHPRAAEATAMLIDRLLPEGGCNYGNTMVLGRVLRPHVEPTGLVLAALVGDTDASGRIERSLDYLERAARQTSGGASLAYALLGLAAHDRRPANAGDWLAAAARQTGAYRTNRLRKALLALAATVYRGIA